ncbi:DUF6191 domain-containing protein [Amycolatopsis sp. NPDC059027]|uniref:DUF6191 domain-containing protein n=1 Tax=unclassified Amycolatopsis TaxID=2618356 RepID=UPI00366E60CB
MAGLGTWLGLGIPASAAVLVAVGAYEMRPSNGRKRLRARLSSTYVEEVTAFLYGTKRTELDHRDSVEMTLDEDVQGAPPNTRIDLDRGVAVLRPENPPARRPPEGSVS